jgi:hypothetical protein
MLGPGERRELGKPYPIGVLVESPGSHFYGESGLAASPRADQRHKPVACD